MKDKDRITLKIKEDAHEKLKLAKVFMRKKSLSDTVLELAELYIEGARGMYNGK